MEALIPMNWTEIHRHFTFLGLLQSFSAVVGIILVLWQIKGLSRSIKGVTQDNLYAHYTQIGNCLFQKPHLWPYFYENKTMSASDSTKTSLRAEIALMSEAILSLIEHAVLQKNNVPDDSFYNCWVEYARDRLSRSGETIKFYKDNRRWYTKALWKVVDPLIEEIENAEQSGEQGVPGLLAQGDTGAFEQGTPAGHPTAAGAARAWPDPLPSPPSARRRPRERPAGNGISR